MKSNTTRSFLVFLGMYMVLNIMVSLLWKPAVSEKGATTKISVPMKYVGISKDKSGSTQYWIATSIYKSDDNTFTIVLGNDKYIEVTSDYFIKIPVYNDSELQSIKTQYGLADAPVQQ